MDRLNIPQTDDELRARLEALKVKADRLAESPLNPAGAQRYCLSCHGTGWVEIDVDGVARSVRCSCVAPDDDAEGVPYEFHNVTFGTYGERDGQTAAIKAAKTFCDAGTRDLYLTGGVGAGKSRLAAAIANTLHRKRRTVHFARVPLLLHSLQPGRDNGQLEERLMTVSTLVLDDIGAERDQATDYTRRTLLMLYEARCDANRRTVFTSNKSLQELAEMQQDDRLTSRIAGRADVVKLTTPDQRLLRRVK